jgi:hypothetical protein
MKLASYMKQHDLDDEAMAALIGSGGASQVKKWKYGERLPRLPDLIRIEEVTGGAVTARDFLPEPSATEERAA